MNLPLKPRAPIEDLIRLGDIEALLRKAGELHGHFCPYVALGVRAGVIALRALGIEQNKDGMTMATRTRRFQRQVLCIPCAAALESRM